MDQQKDQQKEQPMATPVGFYLHNPATREAVLTGKDSSSEYIILMNDALSKKIQTITQERDELVKENNEQEREMDKQETSTQYLRKLLGNLVELKKMSHNLKTSYMQLYENALVQYKTSDKYLCMLYAMLNRYIIINAIILVIMFATGQMDTMGAVNHVLVEFITISMLITNHYDTFSPQDIKTHFKQKLTFYANNDKTIATLKELEDEIKTVEDGHEYLNELITLA